MAWKSGFFNSVNGDRVYNAQEMNEIFKGLITNGVYEAVGNKLAVQPNSGMTIQIATGRGWFNNHWVTNATEYLTTLEASDVTLNRYAAVCVRVDDNDSVRSAEPYIKYSEYATTPVKPTMERSDKLNEYCLAYIYIKAGASEITGADIEDTRHNTELCGYVRGLIDQIDANTLFTQYEAIFKEWFNNLNDYVDENTEVKLANDVLEINNDITDITNNVTELTNNHNDLNDEVVNIQDEVNLLQRTVGYSVGKNLLKLAGSAGQTVTTFGVTITKVDNSTYKLTGTATTKICIELGFNFQNGTGVQTNKIFDLDSNKNYCLSVRKDGTISNVTDDNRLIYVLCSDENTLHSIDVPTEQSVIVSNVDNVTRSWLSIGQGLTLDVTLKLQLEEGTEVTEFEPYVADLSSLSVKTYITEQKTFEITAGNFAQGLFDLPSEIGINEVLGVTILTDGSTYILSNIRSVDKNRIHINFRNVWTDTIGMYAKLLIMYR